MSAFPHRHLLGIEHLAAADILQILDLAETFLEISERPIKKVPTLRGRTVINLFLEASTRTRTSFEIAAKRLSADAINISGSSSSTSKGETTLDTAKNLMAMKPDVIVLRHAASGGAALIASKLSCAVVNAGDGTHEHPSQALLDCATIRKHKLDFQGLEIAIVGDIDHSRVARSDLYAFTRLGAHVRLCGPRTMIPVGIERMVGDAPGSVRVCTRLEQALEGADVVKDAAHPEGTARRGGPVPEHARIFAVLRALAAHPGVVQAGFDRHAPRTDQPRRGARAHGGRRRTLGDPRPGDLRRGGAHGHPLHARRRTSVGKATDHEQLAPARRAGHGSRTGTDTRAGVLIKDGQIVRIAPDLRAPSGVRTLDVSGRIVCPGLVDLHVHFREPGQEYKEDIASGGRAAVAGGFTTVCCMPNTVPTNDCRSVTDPDRAPRP